MGKGRLNMRIDELTGYRQFQKTTFSSFDDLYVYMTKNLNMTYAGRGAWGVAFEHPNGYIVKVVDNDPCYMQFVKYCRQHQDNPHLPRFKSSRILYLDKTAFVVRMEKLSNFSTDYAAGTRLINGINMLKGQHNFGTVEEYKTHLEDLGHEYFDDIDKDKALLQTMLDLTNAMPKNCYADMKYNMSNFMLRGDTVVIIDPWASKHNSRLE